eukprot:scaffold259_cov252-Pinguiococcus_pyrenoidosus.AAC.26
MCPLACSSAAKTVPSAKSLSTSLTCRETPCSLSQDATYLAILRLLQRQELVPKALSCGFRFEVLGAAERRLQALDSLAARGRTAACVDRVAQEGRGRKVVSSGES